MFQHYVKYALGSLERGQQVVRGVSPGGTVRDYLDVGCAYGGSPVAMAKCGVPRCVGIDIDARLVLLAGKLVAEQGVGKQVDLRVGDITNEADTADLGTFDLITCMDVLEPERTVEQLARLTRPDGVVLVDVPNLQSYDRIRRDPHHHLFGSVLLSRDDAIRVFEAESGSRQNYTVGFLCSSRPVS